MEVTHLRLFTISKYRCLNSGLGIKYLKTMYVNRCCNIWMFTLHVLQGASVVAAYETSSPRRSHIQSPGITWKPEHDGKIHQYITDIVTLY